MKNNQSTCKAFSVENDLNVNHNFISWKIKSDKRYTRYYLGPNYPGRYLTRRELEVLSLIQNKTYQEIANLMALSRRTIEAYVKKILDKLCCTSKKELCEFVLQYIIVNELTEIMQ